MPTRVTMDDATSYQVETVTMEGQSFLLALFAVLGFAIFPFVEPHEWWIPIVCGSFFSLMAGIAIHSARSMRRYALELSPDGLRQLPEGRFLWWPDVSRIRPLGDRIEVSGGAHFKPVRVYHQLERFDEALAQILALAPPMAPPRSGYARRPLGRRPITLGLLAGSLLLATWLWLASITLAGFLLHLAVVAIVTYSELTDTASITLTSSGITVGRRRNPLSYPWRDVKDIRFELEYVGKGQHRLNLLLDAPGGPQQLGVAGVDPFELYQAIQSARQGAELVGMTTERTSDNAGLTLSPQNHENER